MLVFKSTLDKFPWCTIFKLENKDFEKLILSLVQYIDHLNKTLTYSIILLLTFK